ncbi:MAG: hypothetical protein ACREUF_01475, partial [Solimonas sp.]
MAKEKGLIQALRGMPAESAAVIARKFAKADLSRLGKIRVLPNGIPIDDVTISVLPHGPAEAKKLIDLLVAQPSIGGFEV